MADINNKTSLLHTEERCFDTSYVQRQPPHRSVARRLWELAMLVLWAGAIYGWLKIQNSNPDVSREMPENLEVCQAPPGGTNLEFDWYALKPSEDIEWTPCFEGQKCARLSLPLDYLEPEGPKTEIALQIIPATDRENYKGTIFVNPGGPGGSGTALVKLLGTYLSRVVGQEFDILGFDPRGTGATTPPAQCFATDTQSKIWALQDGLVLNLTDDSIPVSRSRQQVVGELCSKSIGGNGKEDLNGTADEWGPGRFMSSASVATDMLRIVEKLGQEKLQYWGFSYGTVLGQYFSAMYPDKVGRVVIDGVYDANDYRSGLWFSNLRDIDDVIASFFDFCHQAGPSKCSVYAPTVKEIQERVDSIALRLSEAPIPISFTSKGPIVLTKKLLHMIMFVTTYSPLALFKVLADLLIAIETRDITTLTVMAELLINTAIECDCKESIPWLNPNEAFYAIACGDADEVPDESGDYEAYFKKLTAESPFAAPIWGVHYLQCAEWKLAAKWRYTGPFSGNTSHPLLIISPTHDPVCPLSDAKKVQKRYVGSRLLEQNSYGHCSVAAPSLCTAKNVRKYFADGTLPAEGTVCEVEELPIVGRVGEQLKALSSEDEELLGTLKALTSAMRFGPI